MHAYASTLATELRPQSMFMFISVRENSSFPSIKKGYVEAVPLIDHGIPVGFLGNFSLPTKGRKQGANSGPREWPPTQEKPYLKVASPKSFRKKQEDSASQRKMSLSHSLTNEYPLLSG